MWKKTNYEKKVAPTVHVVGTLSELLLGRESPVKYEDRGNPIVTVKISGHSFPNTLVDLGATINILTTGACEKLGISALEPTATLLELADRSVIRPEGIVKDIMVSVESWEYPADFLVINPKTRMEGHPLILGWPWLATTNAYIGCRTGSMTITRGNSVKNHYLSACQTKSAHDKNSQTPRYILGEKHPSTSDTGRSTRIQGSN